jgi:hypothetical protein
VQGQISKEIGKKNIFWMKQQISDLFLYSGNAGVVSNKKTKNVGVLDVTKSYTWFVRKLIDILCINF